MILVYYYKFVTLTILRSSQTTGPLSGSTLSTCVHRVSIIVAEQLAARIT
jgi:hypothetical protein